MNKIIQYIIIALVSLTFDSCKSSLCREEIDFSEVKEEVEFNRLDKDLFANPDEFIDSHLKFKAFVVKKLIPESQLKKFFNFAAKDTAVKSLRTTVNKEFSDISTLNSEIEDGLKRIKTYFPNYNFPTINYVFTAFGDIHLVKNEKDIYVGLDYFLDAKEKFPLPQDPFPQYIAQFMKKEYLAAKIMTVESNVYNEYDTKNKSLLNDIIAYGKMYYFTSMMLPCEPNAVILSRSEDDMKNMETHKVDIWQFFVKNQLFYKEDRETTRRYLDPRPKTIEIADNCPGMVGQWLGYEIVKSYMNHNKNITLQELMGNDDNQSIFNESGFKSTLK